MAKELGFHHGAPKSKNLTFEQVIGGTTFVFKKEQVKSFFLYNCRCRTVHGTLTAEGSTGFYSERDLTREEIVRLPQFENFIAQRG